MDNNTHIQLASNDEILIYQSQDGIIKIDVLFENETVWLNQNQLCTLFGKSKATISEHIKHIFEEGELDEKAANSIKKEQVEKWLFGITKQPHWSRLQIVTS